MQEKVNYLGHVLHDGHRLLSPERARSPPQTKIEMLSFLGMMNYCRHWIYDYAAMDSVLRVAALPTCPKDVNWNEEMLAAFHALKQAITTALTLGLPDNTFHLQVSEQSG